MIQSKALRYNLMFTLLAAVASPMLARAQEAGKPDAGGSSIAEMQRRRLERREKFEQRRLEMKRQMDQPPQPGSVVTRFSLQNETSNTLWVALYYVPYQGAAGIQSQTAPAAWKLESWLVLNPGETRYVGDTNLLVYYTYAIDSQGHTWGGDDFHRTMYFNSPPGYRDVGFKKTSLGTHPNTYTHGFKLRTP